jgi:rubrerythrin
MSKTKDNLLAAFAGESQANRKYLAYAVQADAEGFPQVAKLFRAVAEAETVHALAHLRNAGKIGSTLENLKEAASGEVYEFTRMYPEMIREAKSEDATREAKYFSYVAAVEEAHSKLYRKAAEAGGKPAATDYYVCAVCGYTHEGPHDAACPVCGAAAKVFYKVA